jgi:hypothetical protein
MKESPQGAATMSNQGRHFEVSNEMQSLAEAGFEQARKALESFLDGAQQTANSIEGRNEAVHDSVRDISSKAISFAQQNMTASLAMPSNFSARGISRR